MQKNKENVENSILQVPFFIMIFFSVIHLSVWIQLDIGGRAINLGFINQVASVLYLGVLYLWALFINHKRWIQLTALGMGCLSAICIAVSLADFGNSANDALCTGSAILTLLYVFENTQYLLKLVKKYDKLLSIGIWMYVIVSFVLFIFFPQKQTQWGEGTYFFGHRYASTCGLVMIIISLKLMNRPKHTYIYWTLLLASYAICYWTGARVYMLSGLGTMYAILFTFEKDTKKFIIQCVAVTLATVLLFFVSSGVTKYVDIAENTAVFLQEKEDAGETVNESYYWVNGLSHGRPEMWERCWTSYEKLPLVNKLIGSGNKYIYDHNKGVNSHTDYLNILHYHGLIGLSVYLFFFIGYVVHYWRKKNLHMILLIGFWGIWFVLALLNGYMNYTANMMSVPYIAAMAAWRKDHMNI